MTIGTTNIGFSTIATEVGLSNTNLSLSDLCRKQIVLDPTNSRQTYTLTDNLTLLFSRSISKIAESIVSPEEKRFGL